MNRTPVYNRVRQPLSANQEFTVNSAGNLVSILAATGTLEIALGDGAMIAMEVGQTVSFQDEEFSQVRILDTSGAINDIDVYIGRGEFFDFRFSSVGDLSVKSKSPSEFLSGLPVSFGAGLNTQACSADLAVVERGFKNLGTAGVWVSHSASVSGRGHFLDPGETFVLTCSDAIYIYNPDAADQLLCVWETRS